MSKIQLFLKQSITLENHSDCKAHNEYSLSNALFSRY